MKHLISQLLDISGRSYYTWKKEERPVIAFLEKYFTEEDLQEFLDTGSMQKLESKNQSIEKMELYENILEDHAFFSIKEKLQKFVGKGILDTRVGMKDILKDVLVQINLEEENYTLENSKQRLIDLFRGSEINWMKLKTPQKLELISTFIQENVSKVEAYVMIKYHKEILDYLDK